MCRKSTGSKKPTDQDDTEIAHPTCRTCREFASSTKFTLHITDWLWRHVRIVVVIHLRCSVLDRRTSTVTRPERIGFYRLKIWVLSQ